MPDTPSVLIVDDEPAIAWAYQQALGGVPCRTSLAPAARPALERLRSGERHDAVVLDIQMPDLDGLSALAEIRRLDPHLAVVIVTGRGTLETAVTAHQRGAFDYLLKPVDLDTLCRTVSKACRATQEARGQAGRSADPAPDDSRPAPPTLVGRSPPMLEVFRRIALAAGSDLSVLIEGETGTGKELVAHAIHRFSPRAAQPLLALNCAMLRGDLLESELFGYERGAFTGAERTKTGLVELAEGGTLFLDEVGELPPDAQARLLRFLETRQFFRLGGTRPLSANVRIVAATNHPLSRRAAAPASDAAPAFRTDLYYRLAALGIALPPLRERDNDVDELVDYFSRQPARLGERGAASALAPFEVLPETRAVLRRYPWPGNVRELRAVLGYAAVESAGRPVTPEHLPAAVRHGAMGAPSRGPEQALGELAARYVEAALADPQQQGVAYERLIERWEGPVLTAAFERMGGNQSQLASALGLHRTTLRRKLRALGLIADDGGADGA